MVFSKDFDNYLQQFSENYNILMEADGDQQQDQNNNQQNQNNGNDQQQQNADQNNQQNQNGNANNNQQQNNNTNQQNGGNKIINGIKQIIQNFIGFLKKVRTFFMSKLKGAMDNDEELVNKAKAKVDSAGPEDKSLQVDWCYASDNSREKAKSLYPDFQTFMSSGKDAPDYTKGAAREQYFEKENGVATLNAIGGLSAIIARHANLKKSLGKVDAWCNRNERAAEEALKKATEDSSDRLKKFFDTFHTFSTEFYQCYVEEYRIVKSAMEKATDSEKNKSQNEAFIENVIFNIDMMLV